MKEEMTLKNSDLYVTANTYDYCRPDFAVDLDKFASLIIIYKNKKYAVDIEKALSLLGTEVK